MTDGQFLHYDGPAAIDGTKFPTVSLREHRDGGLRSWDGSASMAVSQAPQGFAPDLSASDAVPVELPDGRHGKALVTNIHFDGSVWRLELTGTGPAPGYSQS
ncbi:hypothetical protein [Streptomyces sp. NBC_01483]|uniref:hypothetical protein n=1 Tax=Streptomyces sp. NBC_01483 TaxID=2903883 RepID=UPI002E37E7D3|nr:hypothetical protein [Streptomyces sp. NBC_01483]